MSSKFFTWTKGDRRNAPEPPRPGGVVTIPVECITIKGMDYARGVRVGHLVSMIVARHKLTYIEDSKPNRKPLPLAFDQRSEPTSKHSTRTNDSIALHDAAVQSVTSLMAVVNDMLQSPQVSAHLSVQQREGLAPMHGRPRSRTAPSTPLVEAPGVEPAELLGSLLAGKKSIMSLHQSINGKAAYELVQSPTHATIGATIHRPHSSPQQPTYNGSSTPKQLSDSFSYATSLYPPMQLSPRSKSSSPHRFSGKSSTGLHKYSSEDTLVATEPLITPAKRPSLSVLQQWPPNSPSISSMTTALQTGSAYIIPQRHSLPTAGSSLPHTQPPLIDAEIALLNQIRSVRASHEAHLASLREAYERELESHRSYIAFLEQRRGFAQPKVDPSNQALKIDISHTSSKVGELHSADASATTHQSFGSLESRKRASQEAAAEAEALKRKLSLAQRTQLESSEVRRERDQLRHAVDRGDRRITQLKDIVRKSKDQEKSLKNAIADLESRLVAANNERTNVLEGFHEASERVRKLAERERIMKQELEDLRSRLFYANGRHASDTTLALPETITQYQVKHIRTKSDVAGLAHGRDPLVQQISELRRLVAARDARIRQLEQQNETKTGVPNDVAEAEVKADDRLSELEASLYDHKKMLSAARADPERYNTLLHSELRRQIRHAAQKAHGVGTPNVEAESFAAATESAKLMVRSTAVSNPETATSLLERELEYTLKEIVLYKLDIRGYKKDLTAAQAQIEELKAKGFQRPPTPDRDSSSSSRSNASSEKKSKRVSDVMSPGHTTSGLGILLPQPPQTPTQTLASATAAALLSATPPMPTSPPTPRPKTPMGTHKKLPKPPTSRTLSPMPTHTPSMANLH